MTGRTAAKWGRTVKKRVGKLFVWSISPSLRVFFRDKNGAVEIRWGFIFQNP